MTTVKIFPVIKESPDHDCYGSDLIGIGFIRSHNKLKVRRD